MRGAGADIWGSADGFQFAYRTMKGDGEVIARVSSIDWLHAWSKAGVMMRDSLNAGARHVFMLSSSGNGNAFQRRSSSSGSSYNTDANGSPGSFVRITRTGNNFDAYESWDGYNWSWVGSEWIDMPSTIYVGVAVTSHYFGAVTTARLSDVRVEEWSGAATQSLSGGWSSGDIGSVAAGGWAYANGSDVTVAGSGADIWDRADEFHFAYRTMTGDGSIVARVTGIDYYDAWSKGGVMMRDSLTPGSAHAYMLVSAGKGLAFQRRGSNGSASSHTATSGSGAPYYVKLVRSGNTFDAYRSSDGYNWSHVGSEWIAMGSTIYVGVAVTSHNDGAVATGTFSNVAIAEGTTQAAPAPAPAPPPPPPPTSGWGSELRVLHWNTQHLRGADGVFDPYRTAYWISRANADIISLNEIDDEWMAGVITDAVRNQTGVHWNATFSGWGNLILTKLPLNNSSVCHFNPGAGRKAAHLSTKFNGRTINIWSAHLATDSSGTRSYEAWNLQNCAWNWGEAQLIAGDFNMQPYSPEYNVMTSAFADGWGIAKSNGATANYGGNCDGCTRNSRIDYIFSSWSWFLSVKYAEIYDTRDGWGTMASDHKPLIVVYNVQ